MPIRKRPYKRNKKYEKLTDEERSVIMNLKLNGMGCQEIARRLNKNLKTVQSVQYSERKSEYKDLKEAITQYGLDQLLQITSIQSMDDRKLKKLATKIIKSVMPPNNKTMFAHLIPIQKADSNKRRIIDQILNNILYNLQKILITRNMISLFEPNNSSQGDTISMESSEFSQHSYNMMKDDSDILENQNIEDMSEGIINNQYYFDTASEIVEQFEGQSINFLNQQEFEKTIEQSSECYFNL